MQLIILQHYYISCFCHELSIAIIFVILQQLLLIAIILLIFIKAFICIFFHICFSLAMILATHIRVAGQMRCYCRDHRKRW